MTDAFVPCQFMRSKSKQVCVIRLQSTGVILEIELSDPLDVTRACLVCATKPVDAAVRLGDWEDGMHRKCDIRVAWPCPLVGGASGNYGVVPPPMRYIRRASTRFVHPPNHKRQKTSDGT